MTLLLRTFGAVYLERDGTPLGGAHSQRRRLGLLAYLASADGAVITRAKLIALLWPESDEASGRHSLSQLLYALRHDLGNQAISIDSETARLDPAMLPSDVHAFCAALREGKLEEAVELYRGDFLDGFHVDDAPELDRWIDEERARHRAACARALERLGETASKAGDKHRAVEWWRRRVTLDPTDGRATARLMQALADVGDREGALRTARVYEALIREELEAEPDSGVIELVERLRRGASPAQGLARVPNAAAVARPPAPEVVHEERSVTAPAARRPSRRTPWIWAIAGGMAGIAALVLFAMAQNRGGARVGGPFAAATGVTVVIGDLQGPDTVLALAVREALNAELQNTRGVILTSDLGIRELKTLMRLSHNSALQQGQLLALATRAGAHVAIEGSVLPVSNGAVIALALLDPSTGRPMRTFSARPVDAASLLADVGRMGRSIGAAITQTSRDSAVRPLPAVTTASLPALKSYALARQLAAAGKRAESIAPAERAVTHDSTFALAHYFLGDVLWFIDQQTHSEAHLTKAYELIATVPPREQLVIRARYEQLVRDRPDTALVYWELLHDASPGDVLAYEGRAWALRALGRHEEAAASADSAMQLDPAAVAPNTNNVMYSLLGVGDTLGAMAVSQRVAARNPDAALEARFYTALFRGDTAGSVRLAHSTEGIPHRHFRQHEAYLTAGNLTAARIALDSLLPHDRMAYVPNALLSQGLMELTLGGDRGAARRYAQQALDWVRRRDLSPPAVGRLAERIAHLAALAGDDATVRATTALVRERDRGRQLRTYVLTLRTLDAASAFVRGQYGEAARRAEIARHGVYFSRSLATIVRLEADARRAAGEIAIADSLDRLVETHQIVDGNFQTWAMLKAAGALRARGRPQIASTR